MLQSKRREKAGAVWCYEPLRRILWENRIIFTTPVKELPKTEYFKQ